MYEKCDKRERSLFYPDLSPTDYLIFKVMLPRPMRSPFIP